MPKSLRTTARALAIALLVAACSSSGDDKADKADKADKTDKTDKADKADKNPKSDTNAPPASDQPDPTPPADPSPPAKATIAIDCDAVLTHEQLNAACGTTYDKPFAPGSLENGKNYLCSRQLGGFLFSIFKLPSTSKNGEPHTNRRGDIAVADRIGDYTVEVKSSPHPATNELPCTERQLVLLFTGVEARAKAVLEAE